MREVATPGDTRQTHSLILRYKGTLHEHGEGAGAYAATQKAGRRVDGDRTHVSLIPQYLGQQIQDQEAEWRGKRQKEGH